MKKTFLKLGMVLLMGVAITACSSDDENITTTPTNQNQNNNTNTSGTLTITDLAITVSVDENADSGTTLEKISATTTAGTVKYVLKSSTPIGAVMVASDGSIKIDDNAIFDFETNPKITAIITVSDDKESKEVSVTINLNDVNETTAPVGLSKNTVSAVDNADFGADIEMSKVSIDDVSSTDSSIKVFDLRFSTADNHGPLIMTIGQLPTSNMTFKQAKTKGTYDLKANEFKIKYVRSKDNKYGYDLKEAAQDHDLTVTLNNGVLTFNVAAIELSASSVFDFDRKKYNISFSIALSDIEKHQGVTVAKQYDLVK